MESIYLLVFISTALAFVIALLIARLSKLKANTLFIGVFATIVGLLIGSLAYLPLSRLPGIYGTWLPVVFYVISVLGANWVFLTRRSTIEDTLETISKMVNVILNLKPHMPQLLNTAAKESAQRELLVDTSVLIDARIVDIAKTGFLFGKIVVPKFILSELQNIADSEEPMRRAKGRRGLDSLADLKKTSKVEIVSEDVAKDDPVDLKLLHLAKFRKGEVLTTDYNLNKVAKVEGVKVLNINELAQSLRPVLIPGEEMEVKIIQAGKEKNQGVGYLPDGTMIVVEEGDKLVGETVQIVIKRILQTAAGKMFFATIKK